MQPTKMKEFQGVCYTAEARRQMMRVTRLVLYVYRASNHRASEIISDKVHWIGFFLLSFCGPSFYLAQMRKFSDYFSIQMDQ